MKAYLVRHGQTDSNLYGISQGRNDTVLNATGLLQAEAVAGALRSKPIKAIYSSPLQRALQTAAPLAQALGLEVTVDDDLVEMDQGELEGLNREQMQERHPDFLKAWVAGEACDVPIPGGESLSGVQQRMRAAFGRILAGHPDDEVVVVSHSLAIKTYLCLAGGLDLREFRGLAADPGGYAVLVFHGGRTAVEALNEIPLQV
ncbi:MAG: histidine phosphatase family protein [Dehalococcoidia bacterium]